MAKPKTRGPASDAEDEFFGDVAPQQGKRFEDREIDGWYEAAPGIIVAGVLCGTLVINDEDDRGNPQQRRVALLELKRPCKAKNDDKPVDLIAGQVIAVGERAKLEPLFAYEDGAKVWFQATGQKKLKGKRSAMWQFELVIDGKNKPVAATPF